MKRGQVYRWTPDPTRTLGGYVRVANVALPRLEAPCLRGRHVSVRNGGAVYEPDVATGGVRAVPIGDAQPNAEGDFLFEPGRGGGRIDKVLRAEPGLRWRYIQAAHFGEVNTYYHLDAIAAYIHELLDELGASALPRVTAVVNAHHAAVEGERGRDGLKRGERWLPFQGGHYRLPSRRYDIPEHEPIARDGEIHFGPGRQLLEHGALVEAAGGRYRANASHNAGILYHEYGHHVCRYTADFRANALRSWDRQDNRKTAMEEGTCDYWTATMLHTPHIWAWHRRHDAHEIHPRSLVSTKTMADFAIGPGADPHGNGTIWAAALWDLRTRLGATDALGVRRADLLVLKALLLLGQLTGPDGEATVTCLRRARKYYGTGLAALLQADHLLHAGRQRSLILAAFSKRDIRPAQGERAWEAGGLIPAVRADSNCGLMAHVASDEIPKSAELFSAPALEDQLAALAEPPFSLIAVGDIMLGGRATKVISEYGPDYPFAAVLPLLRRAPIVMGNLEAPFARQARKVPRNHAYRVNPDHASALTRAGINVVTLANNHLLDCGRAGVVETLDALERSGVAALGAGLNEATAHAPVIRQAGRWRIGFLGYYWNRRCAATTDLPGCALDVGSALEADIRALRDQVDRVVVTFHWGIPYAREPAPDDRDKARMAIDCGADIVIGHHPHILQPLEIYRGRLIFFSVGNFVMGSGNSRAEGLLLGVRFEEQRTSVSVFPLYVKNRDPRVNYQPKVLRGNGAARILGRLAEMSGLSGKCLHMEQEWGRVDLPRTDPRRPSCEAIDVQ